MIKIKHILDPVNSTKKVYERFILKGWSAIQRTYFRKLAQRQLKKITWSRRDNCWCGNRLLDFPPHLSYGVCSACGCFVNKHPPLRKELNKLYSFDLYWHLIQKSEGSPPIEHREINDLSDGRINCWLSIIKEYGPKSGKVIEVGCGPGIFLKILSSLGYDCLGIEICEQLCNWIKLKRGIDVICGVFPEIDVPSCDMFLAFDVLEHAIEPELFVKKMYTILRSGGIAIIQTPTIRDSLTINAENRINNLLSPFKEDQHLFIFTGKSIRLLLESAHFFVLDDTQKWFDGSEITVVKKL